MHISTLNIITFETILIRRVIRNVLFQRAEMLIFEQEIPQSVYRNIRHKFARTITRIT